MIEYLHPFDIQPAAEDYFVDLRTGAVLPLRTAYGARPFEPVNRYQANTVADLIDAAKRPHTAIILAPGNYALTKPLETAPNVSISGSHPEDCRIHAADGSTLDSIVKPSGPLQLANLTLDGNPTSDGTYRTRVGISIRGVSDVSLSRVLLTGFATVCIWTKDVSHLTAAYCEFTNTRSNHGIGAPVGTENILIISSLFHGLGKAGDDDGYSWDLHSNDYEVAGCISELNHRGCKLPDSGRGRVHHCYIDDGLSGKYAPIAIWKSNEPWGREPDNIYLDNLTLASGQYHVQVSNSFGIFVDADTITPLSKKGAAVPLHIKGSTRPYKAPGAPTTEPPVTLPDVPPVDPPADIDRAALIAEVKAAVLAELPTLPELPEQLIATIADMVLMEIAGRIIGAVEVD